MLLLGPADLCMFSAGQWDLCTQHLIHGPEVSTKLANEHFWRIRIITKLSGMKDHKGRSHSHCILIYVNMAPCGRANPLTLCPLFNFQLISLAPLSSLPSVRKSADLSFQRGLGIKLLIHVYTVHPHLTIQMSGLPYWFTICVDQCLVFFIMTFIFFGWSFYIPARNNQLLAGPNSSSYHGWWKTQSRLISILLTDAGLLQGGWRWLCSSTQVCRGKLKSQELGRLTLCLLNKAALKAQATACPLKHEWHAREGVFWVETLTVTAKYCSISIFPRRQKSNVL